MGHAPRAVGSWSARVAGARRRRRGFFLGGLPPSSVAHFVAALALTQVSTPGPAEAPTASRPARVAVVFDRPEPLSTEPVEPLSEVELPELDERPELVPRPVEPEPRSLSEPTPERALDSNLALPDPLAALTPEPLVPRERVEPEPAPSPPAPQPEVVDRPSPRYPSRALRLGQEGTVTLRAVVGRDGRVVEVAMRESSGFETLDSAARRAFARWRFGAWSEGEPDPRTFTKSFTFSLTAL
ncbi:MAG: TonB family protein [Planctomycetota bacterium]|nr:TonB family protein [Planctomycetota bacterium]